MDIYSEVTSNTAMSSNFINSLYILNKGIVGVVLSFIFVHNINFVVYVRTL